MTTRQLAERADISMSLVKQLERSGIISDRVGGGGRGSAIDFGEDAIAQIEAYKAVRYWLGDGALARVALPAIRNVRSGSSHLEFETPSGKLTELELTAR
jgi:hypothetical protein